MVRMPKGVSYWSTTAPPLLTVVTSLYK